MALLRECPDILGDISAERVLMDGGRLHAAAGVYPMTTALDVPFQVLVLLQNATDSAVEAHLKLSPPRKSAGGRGYRSLCRARRIRAR